MCQVMNPRLPRCSARSPPCIRPDGSVDENLIEECTYSGPAGTHNVHPPPVSPPVRSLEVYDATMPRSPTALLSTILFSTLVACSSSSSPRDASLDQPRSVDGWLEAAGPRELGPQPDVTPSPCGSCPKPGVCVGTTCYEYPKKRVGIRYLAWHAFAGDGLQQHPTAQRRTVEDVIRSASPSFFDILPTPSLRAQAYSFHYQARPTVGFYCLYRKRPAEAAYAEPNFVPDCPNITQTTGGHASIWNVGADFIYLDLTTIPEMGPFADVLGVRPLEVLLEEWVALRAAGTMTPQVAAWLPAPDKVAGKPLTYEAVLKIYNTPTFADLILRDSAGRKVMFLLDDSTTDAGRTIIEQNGGANDVVGVRLGGPLGQPKLSAGVASWMQPCEVSGGFTTIVEAAVPCNQGHTPASPIGSILSASNSYQLSYASLPFQAAGRANGLTLKQQFATAFALQPDWLLINSWNQWIARPANNPFPASMGDLRKSMGVTDDSGLWLWREAYGAEYLSDVESSAEYGNSYISLLASCIRVLRKGGCAAAAGEACCKVSDTYQLIRSLREKDPTNQMTTLHVLSIGTAERDNRVATGTWEEVCNPLLGLPQLCGGSNMTNADLPFQLFVAAGADRQQLMRCSSGADQFFSVDPACEGATVVGPLGYFSTVRTSEMARPLRRCYNATALHHFHWLDVACPTLAGVKDEGLVGYVR
jgi:hypothetical protein